MKNGIMCSLLCPMINKYGFCESALRRVERVQECPHDKLRGTVSPRGPSLAPAGQFTLSKLNTERGRGGGAPDV
ncbi:Uncharacterised protein [uncultured Butyricicoccus sp.]|uniref:Uncharacterized protein n=1 Tax=Agathobaculum ammoniilyticum TaxID=2981778 RepID=A0ABT2U1V6_9FIRM|nr:hypothetical protein [Agathobaculum ammoniilyticum]MCU6788588.1 hypothetical protein [Agathobaculum ammoniilyticum]SCI82259.1 Uncharacterised protein [uncultured Butyricicoccus sp.]